MKNVILAAVMSMVMFSAQAYDNQSGNQNGGAIGAGSGNFTMKFKGDGEGDVRADSDNAIYGDAESYDNAFRGTGYSPYYEGGSNASGASDNLGRASGKGSFEFGIGMNADANMKVDNQSQFVK